MQNSKGLALNEFENDITLEKDKIITLSQKKVYENNILYTDLELPSGTLWSNFAAGFDILGVLKKENVSVEDLLGKNYISTSYNQTYIVGQHNINEFNPSLDIKYHILYMKEIMELIDNCKVKLEFNYIPEFLKGTNFTGIPVVFKFTSKINGKHIIFPAQSTYRPGIYQSGIWIYYNDQYEPYKFEYDTNIKKFTHDRALGETFDCYIRTKATPMTKYDKWDYEERLKVLVWPKKYGDRVVNNY